jgi:Zn-dependent peptidase ImmA (M78 family)
LGDRLSLDLAAILENKLALVDRNFSLEVRADYEMGDQLSAYSDAMIETVKRIVLSEHIYNSLVRREPNANFVAAHELGHWLMHPSTHAFSSKLHRTRFRSAEDDADCFAREFLMPKSTVSQFSTAGQLAMASGVTRDVAARRLEELGRLKDHSDRDKISRGFHDLVRELGKTSGVRSRIGQDVSVSDSPSLQSPPIATDRFSPQQMLDALGFILGTELVNRSQTMKIFQFQAVPKNRRVHELSWSADAPTRNGGAAPTARASVNLSKRSRMSAAISRTPCLPDIAALIRATG